VTKDDVGSYYVKVTNGIGEPTLSTKAVVTVHLKVVITQEPKEVTVNEGEKAEFTVQATGEEPLKYQWLKDGLKQSTTASYSMTTVRLDNNKISCIVSNAFSADTSAVVLLTVTPVYKVTFSDGVAAQSVKQGDKATEPAEPKKTGYEFDGWYSGSTKFEFNTPVTSDLYLTAKWAQTFTLTYHVNGGSGNPPAPEQIRGGESATIKPIGSISRAGCTCLGWGDNQKTYNGGDKLTITGNTILYAVWQATVTFSDPEGGTQSSPIKVIVDGKTPVGTLPTPSRGSNYTFAGWFNGNSQILGTSKIDASMTVTARWTMNKYTVTLNANGGSGGQQSVQVNAGANFSSVENSIIKPTWTGHTFTGWSTLKNSPSTVGVINSNGITVYAQWQPIKCTVTFTSQDPKFSPKTMTVNYGDKIPNPGIGQGNYWYGTDANNESNGCIYEGWYLNASGGQNVYTSDWKVTGNVTVTTTVSCPE
jgi:uncharacterized repeat protein (TIGR02543 family)